MNSSCSARWILAVAMLLVLGSPVTATAGSLRDLEGVPHNLEDYTGKGHWLVVMLWAFQPYQK